MHALVLTAGDQNGLTAFLYHCNYTHGVWLFTQVCSDSTSKAISLVQGRMHALLLTADGQNRLTALLCQCNYTHGVWLFTQVYLEAQNSYPMVTNLIKV